MDDKVGVTTNGRGEVGIVTLGETVVAERFNGVTGSHKGFKEADLEGGTNGEAVEPLQEPLDFEPVIEIPGLNVVAEHFLPVFLEAAGIGFFMDAVDGGAFQVEQAGGYGFVREEHEFLDQLMRNVVLDFFDTGNRTVFVETNFHFGKVEREGAGLEAAGSNGLSETMGAVKHLLNGASR